MLAIFSSTRRSEGTALQAASRKVVITAEPIPPDELDGGLGQAAARRRNGRGRTDDFEDTETTPGAGPQNSDTLRRGSRGSIVYELQEILGVQETGVYDAATEQAVRKFQRENDMDPDGWVGAQTAELLGLTLGGTTNEPDPIDPGTSGHWDDDVQPTNPSTLHRGSTGSAVKAAQRKLNVRQTGVYDDATEAAVRRFQSQRGMDVDGWVGPQTAEALGIQLNGSGSIDPGRGSGSGPRELQATIDEVKNRGARTQMILGRITINGRTYKYRSGGHGKGSLPPGRYTVTPHMRSRDDRSMSVGGVGWSFALSDKYDPRVGATRGALRIHPDGGSQGTIGCMGIVGNADTMRRFRDDMYAVLNRRGSSLTLTVG